MKQESVVLLVEDHHLVREYVGGVLRAKGYEVLEAETVVEAEGIIDDHAEQPDREKPARHIGAIILDGRFPYDDDRDDQEDKSPIDAAKAVVRHALARGLSNVAFIGFSSSNMTAEDLGIDAKDGLSFTNVGKQSGGPKQILEVLATIF